VAQVTKLVSDYDLKAQHAIQSLLTPLYEYELHQREIYQDWDNTRHYAQQQSHNSPRFT